jgi:hypothetical protein
MSVVEPCRRPINPRYEISRSGTDNRINVICREGEFYSLPSPILHLGPWTGGGRGDIERLRPH